MRRGENKAPLLSAAPTVGHAGHIQELPSAATPPRSGAGEPPGGAPDLVASYESLPLPSPRSSTEAEPAAVEGGAAPGSSRWVSHAVPKAERLRCLDALRGLAIAVMVFVNAGGAPRLHTGHTPWDSNDAPLLHLADYACPGFVFCIGAAMGVAFVPKDGKPPRSKAAATKHALRRFLLLGIIGLFIKNGTVQGFGERFDLSVLRLPSVLGRLGGAYLIAALVLIWMPSGPPDCLKPRRRRRSSPTPGQGAACSEVVDFGWKWVAVLLITALYLVLTFAVPYHAGCPIGYLGPGGTDCGPNSPWGHHASCDGCNATTGEGCPLRECTAGFMGAFDKAALGERHLTAQGRSGSMCAGEYKCVDFDVRSCLLLPPPRPPTHPLHHHNNNKSTTMATSMVL